MKFQCRAPPVPSWVVRRSVSVVRTATVASVALLSVSARGMTAMPVVPGFPIVGPADGPVMIVL